MNSKYYICINIPNKRNEYYFNYTARIGMNFTTDMRYCHT